MQLLCLICDKWISDWSQVCGKTTTLNGKIYHTECLKNKSIAEIEDRKGNGQDTKANFRIAFPREPEN